MTTGSGGGLRSGDPGAGWQGRIGRTLKESTPWWRPQRSAAVGAPNIVFILLDDLGFSDFGCYGGEIATPAVDAIAAGGLRFTGYTTVPMCTPARAALLTGKNPHSVGCGWLTHANPGYPGYQAGEITPDAPTMPELLREAGYSTYAVGKWHNTADYNVSAGAARAAWPLQRGFDRFYGFLGAETNYHSPGQIIEGNDLAALDAYPENYFCTDDWTDRAIGWLRAHRSACPQKPFFLYYASNAPHVPLHVKPQDLARYRGRYDAGWEALRAERFARQQALGIVGEGWRLPDRYPGVPDWAAATPDQRRVMAAYMELYAALVDHTDQCIARLMGELDKQGIADNTLVIVTSDNGASSIGGPDGAANVFEKRVTQMEDPSMPLKMLDEGTLGGVESYPAYPIGWGNASNTPFRFFKRTPMNGGIRVPFIVRWPARIKDAGAIRRPWVHATDVLPTVLSVVGADYPDAFNGYRTRGLDGSAFTALLDGPDRADRPSQHYELEGNRGYVHGQWKIVSLQPPGAKIDLSNWMLFDLQADPTECDNLAAARPDVLAEMVARFESDADANYVYPLDNRTMLRGVTLPPFILAEMNAPRVFYPDSETAHPYGVSMLVADRDYVLTCSFAFERGQEGVLFAIGDSAGGLAAWIVGSTCHVVWRGGAMVKRIVTLPLAAGEQRLTLTHRALGKRRAEATITLDSSGSGAPAAATLDMSPTILRLGGEGLDVGCDRRLKVAADYDGRGAFRYPGRIDWLRIEPGPMAPGSMVNRAEVIAQQD